MWWFRRSSKTAQPVADPAKLIEILLVRKLEAEAKIEEARSQVQVARVTAELGGLERELKLRAQQDEQMERRRAASRANAVRARAAKVKLQGSGECLVCTNPSSTALTVADIQRHATHHGS